MFATLKSYVPSYTPEQLEVLKTAAAGFGAGVCATVIAVATGIVDITG